MKFSELDAKEAAVKLHIDYKTCGFTPEEFVDGMRKEPTNGISDPALVGKKVLSNLMKNRQYYQQ